MEVRIPANVFNRLLLERKGGLPIKEDFWAAMNVMVRIHGRFIYLNQPIHQFERWMRFWGNKMPQDSRKYINGRINRLLGRPTWTERQLRKLDDAITKVFAKIPFMTKEAELEFQGGFKEVIEMPRVYFSVARKGLPFLKAVR